jgi:hypothetical protein
MKKKYISDTKWVSGLLNNLISNYDAKDLFAMSYIEIKNWTDKNIKDVISASFAKNKNSDIAKLVVKIGSDRIISIINKLYQEDFKECYNFITKIDSEEILNNKDVRFFLFISASRICDIETANKYHVDLYNEGDLLQKAEVSYNMSLMYVKLKSDDNFHNKNLELLDYSANIYYDDAKNNLKKFELQQPDYQEYNDIIFKFNDSLGKLEKCLDNSEEKENHYMINILQNIQEPPEKSKAIKSNYIDEIIENNNSKKRKRDENCDDDFFSKILKDNENGRDISHYFK